MKSVQIKNLSFTYKNTEKKALDDIDFDLEEGEMIVIMGRTGAGKSTLCRCLNGVIPKFNKGDFSGEVLIFGESTRNKHIYELSQKVGLVFQDFEPQLFSTNVELEVAFGPENIALPRDEIKARVKYALKTVGLEGFEDRQPYNLSGGEKQRLAIASVISSKPRILVLDEPTTDLDPKGRGDILSALRKLKDESISLILVEQDAEDVLDADKIVIMDNGKILLSGKTTEVFSNIGLLEEYGIRPPQITKLFEEISQKPLPFTIDEAYLRLKNRLNSDKYECILREDEKRKDVYGQVAIEIKGLKYSYPETGDVLNGVDLQIREGEFVAIIGQNGSGKTTLAKHLNGMLRPSSGKIFCFGRDTENMNISELGKIVGYVFQNPDHQIFASTVKDELVFGPKNYGISQTEIETNVQQALKAVHLEGYEDKDPFLLTKGERQRIAVASVLSCKPGILILDEPTTGLDYSQQKSMMELLQNLNAQGHTIIIITHALWVVAEYAHRAIVMNHGKIDMDGTVREIFSKQDILERIGMKVPEIIKLGSKLGKTLLSVEEYKMIC